jgi:heme o synthase
VIKNYFLVAKPWIVFANLISAAGGFFLAAQGHVSVALLLSSLIGISFMVASGCVFNNYIDRDIDRKMARTCHRVLARQAIALNGCLLYAVLLGIAGLATLWAGTNPLTLAIVLAGFAIYVGAYSLYLKRNSAYSTLIGSLAGAAPPLAAYCAVRNRLDLGALLLLAIFSLWQIPHSYAISIFRHADYAAAKIPVMPVHSGIPDTKKHCLVHIFIFMLAAQLLTFCGYTGYAYLAMATALGLSWLSLAFFGYKTSDDRRWAKKMSLFSIFVIFILSIMMSVDYTFPVLQKQSLP